MRLFVPIVAYVEGSATNARPSEKFGGLPQGISHGDWPRCAECGEPMSHICRFQHHEARLHLGGGGRVLTLWQCENNPGLCATWSATSGANAAIVSEEPEDSKVAEPPALTTVVFPEAEIHGWVEDDDGVPPELVGSYFNDDLYLAMGEDWWMRGGFDTRLGGVPAWFQSAEEGPRQPWLFVGQVSGAQRMTGVVPSSDATGFGIQRRTADGWTMERPDDREPPWWIVVDESGWYLPGPNFGGGLAYLFLNREVDPPLAAFFWQR